MDNSEPPKGPPKFEKSIFVLIVGVLFLFALAIITVVVAPRHLDDSWRTPSSSYQQQMYEVSDPHLYINCNKAAIAPLTFVRQIFNDYTLLSFEESDMVRIWAPEELQPYIKRYNDPTLILSSRLLLLRPPRSAIKEEIDAMQSLLQEEWKKGHPDWEAKGDTLPHYVILELYDPKLNSAFIWSEMDTLVDCWSDSGHRILGTIPPYANGTGTLYVKNPQEYRIRLLAGQWIPDPNGKSFADLSELTKEEVGFISRKDLIKRGEEIYCIEGCWYCHTDQSRTLVQDCILNASEDYPAPPSSAHEYIYQEVTFPGTRRIGPDLARVGIKQPSRDWHKGHFWAPESKSAGSIMPLYHQFFDAKGRVNCDFEAIFQYLMTKGTRILPPTQAWWTGKDPSSTLGIIERTKHD